eukprot:693051-Prorocentrum_minimum.AAC.1
MDQLDVQYKGMIKEMEGKVDTLQKQELHRLEVAVSKAQVRRGSPGGLEGAWRRSSEGHREATRRHSHPSHAWTQRHGAGPRTASAASRLESRILYRGKSHNEEPSVLAAHYELRGDARCETLFSREFPQEEGFLMFSRISLPTSCAPGAPQTSPAGDIRSGALFPGNTARLVANG